MVWEGRFCPLMFILKGEELPPESLISEIFNASLFLFDILIFLTVEPIDVKTVSNKMALLEKLNLALGSVVMR